VFDRCLDLCLVRRVGDIVITGTQFDMSLGHFAKRCLHHRQATTMISHASFFRYESNISARTPIAQSETFLRRPRPVRAQYTESDDGRMPNVPSPEEREKVNTTSSFGAMTEPYEHGEKDTATYLKKTSLSPWTPVPDSVARRMFDLARAGPNDIHVDLGSGDGRVNFHAIDFGLKRSVGIDIDETIVQLATERLRKRHPPPDVEFIVADLLNATANNVYAWSQIQQATVVTMYFVDTALERLRPLLEKKLVGKSCRVVTCGYAMPGWESSVDEVVLGMELHLYEWGSSSLAACEDNLENMHESTFIGDDVIHNKPRALLTDALETKFAGANIIDRTLGFRDRQLQAIKEDGVDESLNDNWDAEENES
jgi:hypothetical protein